jgi:carboxyl-terminal processing protease
MKPLAQIGMGMVLGAGAALGIAAARGAADDATYRQLALFSQAFQTVRDDYVEPVKDIDLIRNAMQGMTSRLDPHSSYMDPRSYTGTFLSQTRGQFGGIGVTVTAEDKAIRVTATMDGMPAAAAGMKTDDRITAIDGKSVEDFNAAIDSMRGRVGSKVVLTVVRASEKNPFQVTLTRATVPVNATTYRREGDIGYIRMPGFNQQTADGLEKAVRELKRQIGAGLQGYVLDLRGNPGGLVDQAVRVSDDLLDDGEIVSTRGRNSGDTQRYDAKKGDIMEGRKLVVLINAGTASASEIVSGALQDHKRATIVGMTSFGKGSVQTIIPLNNGGGALRLTTARYYTPSGHSIQAMGIVPDIQVAQGGESEVSVVVRNSEAELEGHLAGEPLPPKRVEAPVIEPAPGKKYDDFQLSYALDLLRGNMTVATVTRPPKAPIQSAAKE